MKKVPLTQGKFALVDDEDFEKISWLKWHCSVYGYAVGVEYKGIIDGKEVRKDYRMHRIIMNAPSKMVVDHINGDKLDNRRGNLRLCTQSQNCMNRRPHRGSVTGYKGVYFNRTKNTNPYYAQIFTSNKRRHLGTFPSAEEASEAYKRAAIINFKEFAYAA